MKESSNKTRKRISRIIRFLRAKTRHLERPAATKIVEKYGRDPYLILISCLLSLRTRDAVSYPASVRLFAKAKTPRAMLKLSPKVIEKLIYPVGFYRNKAHSILSMSSDLLERFKGKVPKSKQELLSIKGIGPKTANLVLSEAFGIPAICVDTHVHRISNQIGLVKTKTPEETEKKLIKILPKQYWREWNSLLVMWGQNKEPIAPLRNIWQGKP
jgi:endonuclease-3